MSETLFDGLALQALAKCEPAKTGLLWSVFLSPDELLPAVRRLYETHYFIEDITAIDASEGYLIVYHFDHFDHFDHMDHPGRIALRVLLTHENRELPSIASVFQGAEWHERETTDFYGITFAGNPNPIPLLLIPEMKGHPLQKDDGARALLTDLLPACEIVRAASGFDLLTPKAESGEATPA